MEQSILPLVVGVRFSKVGKIYHFTADDVADVKVGDMVVVETSRGWQLGQVAQIVPDPEKPPEGWKPIDRRATPRDLLLRQMWQMKEAEVVENCRARAGDIKLVGIKIVSAEYSFDGSRLTILFSSETEEKFDLKSLRQDMQKMFGPSLVEMRQIGPRDVAKTVCGMGACGLETRCCCLFLTEFSSISIRMAKEQGISLTPTEITGMCGRLRCCLIYEYDNYVDARAKLPKRNKRVRTPQGEGKVVDVIPLRGAVVVDIPEVGPREFPGSDVTLVEDGGGQPGGQSSKEPPFKGTRQPSEIDQAIVAEANPEPFVIAPDETNAPVVDDQATSPESTPGEGQQARQARPRREEGGPSHGRPRGGKDRGPGGREGGQGNRRPPRSHTAPQGKESPGNQEPRGGKESSGGKDQPQGGRGPRRDRRPRGPQTRSGGPPRDEGQAGNPTNNPTNEGDQGSRDDRRRKGWQRRDNSNNENRA